MKLGNVKEFRCVIENQDVTDGVIGFKIFMDMTSPAWSAQIFFLDSADLLSKLPIRSGSKIKLLIETEHGVSTDMKKEFEFVIYRIGDKMMQNQQTLKYTAFAVTNDFITNLSARISRNFVNTKMTEAIKTVCRENFFGMKVNGIDCDNNANLIIPNWTPYNSIGWMLKMAHVNGRADFLFFQTEQDTYTIDSILNAFTQSATDEVLKIRPANLKLETPTDIYNIHQYEYRHTDASVNMASGFYGNKLKTFDFREKKWEVQEYKTSEAKNWQGEMFENASDSVVNFKSKSKGVNGDFTSPSEDANIWLQSRMASLLNLEQEKLIAQTPGSVGTYKWLGKTVNVDFPDQDSTTDTNLDRNRSGRYLVTAIVLNFDRQTFTTNFELVKRGFAI